MQRSALIVFICLLVPGIIPAQDSPGLKTDLAIGLAITAEKIYDGSSLYGYIDGGAELYLAYNFEHLLLQELTYGKRTYTIQVYAMKDADNAYGIYSLYRYRCLACNVLTLQDCLTPYQYLASKQKYYLSVINEVGDSIARVESLRLAGMLLDKIPEGQPEWPVLYTIQPFADQISSIKFIRGMTGLQQGMIDWSSWFEGFGPFSFWVLPLDDQKDGTVFLASIDFSGETDRDTFIKRTSATLASGEQSPGPETKLLAWKKGKTQLVFLHAEGSETDITGYISAIQQEVAPPIRL
jgi:hypothetical protein